MKVKKVLLTGGAGYIGSHTVVELLNQGYELVVLDNFSNSRSYIIDRIEAITSNKVVFEEVNVTDAIALSKLFEKHADIDTVIHFAAYKSVGESVNEPLKYYENNVGGLVTLLKVCEKFAVANFLFSSSCSVYGNPSSFPVTEDTPLGKCESPYANSKKICEEVLMDYSKVGKLKIASLRYFNPIGAHASGLIGELPLNAPTNLLPVVTQTAIGKRASMQVFGADYNTKDGSCVRDYIHVVDLAHAHIAAIEFLAKQNTERLFEVFNIGTGEGVTVLELIHEFEKISGVKLNYILSERRSGDVEKVWADVTKANKLLGWKVTHSLQDSISSYWQWENKLKEADSLKN